MGEGLDAVVVDCDNEQNATLLFKSARNTAHNQSALAVAVVEGQAGVAKAFRIGANLVLTKPINVEQAKGTLRVARGLLRKSEGAKPAASSVSSAVKPAAAAPPKLVLQPSISSAASAPPAAPMAMASVPAQKPASQPSIVASVTNVASIPVKASIPIENENEGDIFDLSEETATAEPKIETAGNKTTLPGFGASAASAPAPAREPKPGVSAGDKTSTTVAEPESSAEKAAGESSQAQMEEPSGPVFTFGGNVDETKSSSGSKKALLGVAAVVVIAACGYVAWMQWGHTSETSGVPAHMTSQPVTSQAVTSAAVSNAAAPGASSTVPSATVPSAIPDSASPQPPNRPSTTSADTQTTASLESAPVHSSKGNGESSKPSPSPAANQAPATKAEPIMIKS